MSRLQHYAIFMADRPGSSVLSCSCTSWRLWSWCPCCLFHRLRCSTISSFWGFSPGSPVQSAVSPGSSSAPSELYTCSWAHFSFRLIWRSAIAVFGRLPARSGYRTGWFPPGYWSTRSVRLISWSTSLQYSRFLRSIHYLRFPLAFRSMHRTLAVV